jgi:hypothetical protein
MEKITKVVINPTSEVKDEKKPNILTNAVGAVKGAVDAVVHTAENVASGVSTTVGGAVHAVTHLGKKEEAKVVTPVAPVKPANKLEQLKKKYIK